jgi:hypothetical protein
MVCEKQGGSLANVLRAGLASFQDAQFNLSDYERQDYTRRAIEEANALEAPILERNLIALSTIASIATMVGLLGTTIGMIRSFAAMATTGAPDAIQLALGISEALVNPAGGLTVAIISIVAYNFFVNVDHEPHDRRGGPRDADRSLPGEGARLRKPGESGQHRHDAHGRCGLPALDLHDHDDVQAAGGGHDRPPHLERSTRSRDERALSITRTVSCTCERSALDEKLLKDQIGAWVRTERSRNSACMIVKADRNCSTGSWRRDGYPQAERTNRFVPMTEGEGAQKETAARRFGDRGGGPAGQTRAGAARARGRAAERRWTWARQTSVAAVPSRRASARNCAADQDRHDPDGRRRLPAAHLLHGDDGVPPAAGPDHAAERKNDVEVEGERAADPRRQGRQDWNLGFDDPTPVRSKRSTRSSTSTGVGTGACAVIAIDRVRPTTSWWTSSMVILGKLERYSLALLTEDDKLALRAEDRRELSHLSPSAPDRLHRSAGEASHDRSNSALTIAFVLTIVLMFVDAHHDGHLGLEGGGGAG